MPRLRPRALLWLPVLMATLLSMPAARSFATTGCPPSGAAAPPGNVAEGQVGDLDWDGAPDTLWVGQRPDGPGHTGAFVGVITASGDNSDAEISPASPISLAALAVDAQLDGQHEVLVSDGRTAYLYVFANCRIQAVVDNQGAPFLFDLQNLRDNGTGVGCVDLGPRSAGRHLAGLQALNDGPNHWTIRRTEIDVNGTLATIGQSDSVTATSATDPAVVTAKTISCGDLTISKDGVRQR